MVIVNWNTREMLRRCLSSLQVARQELESGKPARSLEVIVVDNASTDGSADMVTREFRDVRLVANATNRNYAAGTNQALGVAQGCHILLLNPDTELPERAPRQLLECLEARGGVGAVAPALVHADGGVQPSVRGFPTVTALVGEITGLGRLFPGSRWAKYRTSGLQDDAPSPVEQPMASCLLVRGEALRTVGTLDEQFPLFFNDVDLCYRLRQAGWEIMYDPRVRVLHHGGASTRQVRAGAIWQSHTGLLRFYRKHFRPDMNPVTWAAVRAAILASGGIRVALAWMKQVGSRATEQRK